MASEIRKQVLSAFKMIHRTRQKVFYGDEKALTAARERINNEFQNNKNEEDPENIKKMIGLANEVEAVLRTQVIQAVATEPGMYKAVIREETTRLENTPYQDMPESMIGPFKRKRTKCSEKTEEQK